MITVRHKLKNIRLYFIGDVHIGSRDCDEAKLQRFAALIRDEGAYWIGGGDYCDNIIVNDAKRFEPSVLPKWLLERRSAGAITSDLQDLAQAQARRFQQLLQPIRNRCLGLIQGNHEQALMKHHNHDLMPGFCDYFQAPGLSDCAFVDTGKAMVFISHGQGGGRTPGAEANSLHRLAVSVDADIICKGHSHTFMLLPPVAVMGSAGTRIKYAANWGCWTHTYTQGPGSYASRALYAPKPLFTAGFDIGSDISMFQVKL